MPTILLADPQGVVREGVRLLVEQHPDWIVVGEAREGDTAIELVRRLRPDVAILETVMPRMSGMDATREIVRSGCGSKVLILSSHNRQSLVQSALRAGAKGYVTKQSSSKDLVEAIEVLIGGGNYLSPDVMPHVVEAFTGDGDSLAHGLASLTHRERQVLQLIAEGLSSKEIGQVVGVAFRTVESYRASLMDKLGLHKVASLVRFAIREGLVEA